MGKNSRPVTVNHIGTNERGQVTVTLSDGKELASDSVDSYILLTMLMELTHIRSQLELVRHPTRGPSIVLPQ